MSDLDEHVPLPRNPRKLREHIENDQFIVSAVRDGIINRIIMIFPFFSKNQVRPDRKKVKYVNYGSLRAGLHDSKEGALCECECRHRGCAEEEMRCIMKSVVLNF